MRIGSGADRSGRRLEMFAIVAVSLVGRLIAARYGLELTGSGLFDPLYEEALTQHFWSYAAFFHSRTPGILLRDLVLIQGAGIWGATAFTALADTASALLLFSISSRVGLGKGRALVTAVAWSLALISWEFWYGGGHFDHLNVFLYMLFSWAAVRYVYGRGTGVSSWISGVAGALLVAFQTVAFVVVPVAAAILAILVRRRGWVVILLPLFVSAAVVGKNYALFGVAATSTVGGQNALQFVGSSDTTLEQSDRVEKLARTVHQYQQPDWWRWCFDNALQHSVKLPVEALYGMCYGTNLGASAADLRRLEARLLDIGETGLAAMVVRDRDDLMRRPWLFTGGYASSNTRIAVEYGKVSRGVWVDFVLGQPQEALLAFRRATSNFLNGPRFLFDGHQHAPEPFRLLSLFVYPPLWLGIIGAHAVIVLWVARLLRAGFRRARDFGDEHKVMLVLALVFVGGQYALNISTCCENNRMFISFASPCMVIGCYVLNEALGFAGKSLALVKSYLRK